MHFKITARTILQLGAELISSDAIAFYELMKNAFDAGSPKVEVRIVIRLDQSLLNDWLFHLQNKKVSKLELKDLISEISEAIDQEAPKADLLKKEIQASLDKDSLIAALRQANYILIKDTGEGMTLDDLDRIYLTIGTRNRYEQRIETAKTKNRKPILGEKGLGRLSVMRLGEGLIVETTKQKESHYNLLKIDWSIFSHDSNDLLESIEVEPKIGKVKTDSQEQGTSILVYDLKSKWTESRLKTIAQEELSRFIDPFQPNNIDFISLWFNKKSVLLSGIDTLLFENAQASMKAEFSFNKSSEPKLFCGITYNLYNKYTTFESKGTHLYASSKATEKVLQALGPFTLELYYYNRKRISVEWGVTDIVEVKKLVERWGGGIMVYRDGFRVNPYGGPDDDWLKLDTKALSAQGYKLNRRQFVGRLNITSTNNPRLVDQTNREGLRDNPEKEALIAILQHIIWVPFKKFLEGIEQQELERQAVDSLAEIEKRITVSEKRAKNALNHLIAQYPEIKDAKDDIESINQVLHDTKELIRNARASSDSLEKRLNTTIHLAGLGLMVDVIGHELNRATHHAITMLNKLTSPDLPQKTSSSLVTLKQQLKTLQTRLKILDPLGPSGRQRKEPINIRTLVDDIISYHSAQFERHHIKLEIIDTKPNEQWIISVVPGMIIQILENLISNAVYWLKQEAFFNNLKNPKIVIELQRKDKVIIFYDNGPGIPRDRAEDIFQPFFSTRPADEGKGLGLYISREIALYNGAQLYLMKENAEILRKFVLNLSNTK